jgi:hypothetical protein
MRSSRWATRGARGPRLNLGVMPSVNFSVEEGLPRTQVLLWVAGEHWRAVYENVVLAEYRCRYGWRDHTVHDIQEGMLYPTRFASRQGRRIPFKHGHDPLYTGGEFRRLVRTRPALCHRVLHTAERARSPAGPEQREASVRCSVLFGPRPR